MTAAQPETTVAQVDPFGGTSENWSLPGRDWPPADAGELARLDQWASDMEREMAGRGDE